MIRLDNDYKLFFFFPSMSGFTELKDPGYLVGLKQRDCHSAYCITTMNFIVVEIQRSNFSFKAITHAS